MYQDESGRDITVLVISGTFVLRIKDNGRSDDGIPVCRPNISDAMLDMLISRSLRLVRVM